MAVSTKIVFTAVPSPRQAPSGEVRLGVVVSPRLSSTTGSAVFGAFDFAAVPWPTRLLQIQGGLRVRWDGGPPVAVTLAPPLRASEALDAALWRAIFPATRTVEPFTMIDWRGRLRVDFPASDMDALLHETYRQIAAVSPPEVPRVAPTVLIDGPLTSTPSPLESLIREAALATDALKPFAFSAQEAAFYRDPPAAAGTPGARPGLLYRCQRFYQRRPIGVDSLASLETFDGDFEFHEIVGLLGDHPTLLRKLGLAFDVILPAGQPPAASGTVEVDVPWRTGAGGPDLYPRTRYTFSSGRFLPAPSAAAAATLQSGCLRLDQPAFRVTQLDVDGGALKLSQFAMATRQLLTREDQEPITRAALPALRSGGLTLLGTKQNQAVAANFERQALLGAATGPVELFAEDLVRGYRIDVLDSGRWHSLCRRFGDIGVAGATVVIDEAQDEEGQVSALTLTEGGFDENELYVHQAIAGWGGYSLCARPPGKSIVHDDTTDLSERVADVGNEASGNVDIRTNYRAPRRSLPRLRFGRDYRMRARIADLAGGGVTLDGAFDASVQSPSIRYRRFEPVATPLVLHRTPITEGEWLEFMVIRSDSGATPAEYAQRPASVAGGYAAVNQRHLLPPKAGLALVETHGFLDAALASREAARGLYYLAQRESGNATDAKAYDLDTGLRVGVPDLELEQKPSDPTPPGPWPEPGTSLRDGQYVLHKGDFARLSYLPDPVAEGVGLWEDAPRSDSQGVRTIHMPWPRGAGAHAWARLGGLRIELSHASDGLEHRDYSASDPRVLRVSLPPGHRMILNYASTPVEGFLDHMAVWGLLSAAERSTLLPHVRDGKHWMMTPARQLTLVHAVQRPVMAASFSPIAVALRQAGETTAKLTGFINCHGESTAHVDVRARWSEIVDVLGERAPRLEPRQTSVERVPVAYGQRKVELVRDVTTKKRKRVLLGGYPSLTITETREALPVVHDVGDTRARYVHYEPVGTTRYLEHFPAAVIQDRTQVETSGLATPLLLRATLPPVPPRVAQILPLFVHATSGTTHYRLTGLRIYLERPWASSGVGELLGLVLKQGAGDVTDVDRPHVCMWGRDPVWNAPSPVPLALAQLATDATPVTPFGSWQPTPRTSSATTTALGGTKDIFAIVPEYNAERGLWFADVQFTTQDSYSPFISLALVRYQPNAIDGAFVSTVTRADFIQLPAGRAATVTTTGSTIAVTVGGTHAGNLRSGAQANVIRAAVQRRRPAQGDLGWEFVSGASATLAATTATSWTGTLTKPTLASGYQYRLLIWETEVHDTDDATNVRVAGERFTYVEMVPVT